MHVEEEGLRPLPSKHAHSPTSCATLVVGRERHSLAAWNPAVPALMRRVVPAGQVERDIEPDLIGINAKGGNLTINGSLTMGGPDKLTVGGEVAAGRISSKNDGQIDGKLTVGGEVTAGRISSKNDGQIGGSLTVDGYLLARNGLEVLGDNATQLRLYNRNSASWDIYTAKDGGAAGYVSLAFRSVNTGRKFWLDQAKGLTQWDLSVTVASVPLGPVLDRVNRLHPVAFLYKTSGEDTLRALGFITRDVEPLFPEMVSESEGTKGLAYEQFLPVAIAGIQELSAQVGQLKQEQAEKAARTESLERQVAELRKLVADLERQLKSLPAASNESAEKQ